MNNVVTNYIILKSRYGGKVNGDLGYQVETFMTDGWLLQGSAFSHKEYICQAMVKVKEDANEG